eukprot:6188960-Pleurochrysis_carterae.AAC.3
MAMLSAYAQRLHRVPTFCAYAQCLRSCYAPAYAPATLRAQPAYRFVSRPASLKSVSRPAS